MTTATEKTTEATTRGFAVACIHCGETGCVRTDLSDLSQFVCTSCDTEFTADDVREFVRQWAKVLAWIDTAPEMA